LTCPYSSSAAKKPLAGLLPHAGDPLPDVGRQGRKVQIQAVAGERRNAAGRQPPAEIVDDGVGGGLGARAGYPLGDATAE